MVERDNAIVETQREVRRLELVVAWAWQPLDMMAQVIAKQSRRPSLEGRQSGNSIESKKCKQPLHRRERIALGLPDAINGYVSLARQNPGKGIGGDKRIAAKRGSRQGGIQVEQTRPI